MQNSEKNFIFCTSINMLHNEANSSPASGYWLAGRDERIDSSGFCLAYGKHLIPSLISVQKKITSYIALPTELNCLPDFKFKPLLFHQYFLLVWVLIPCGCLRNPHFCAISITQVYCQWSKQQEFIIWIKQRNVLMKQLYRIWTIAGCK